MTRRPSPIFASLLFAAAAPCGLSASGPGNAGATETTQIAIKNFSFNPSPLKIKAGSAVTWVNKDQEPHTVVSDTGLFRSGAVDTDETFVFKFDKPGTYHFICTIHPKMTGTIVVE